MSLSSGSMYHTSDHASVARTLRNHRRFAAALELTRLRALRELADYDLNVNIAQRDWLDARNQVDRLIALLSPDWA
jgi:hypothetical protein